MRASQASNNDSTILRRSTHEDTQAMLSVARSLPAWFTPRGCTHMNVDFKFQKGFVARRKDKIIGFLTFYVNEGNAHIAWMGVREELHRQGIGRRLVEELFRMCKTKGVGKILVTTLGDSVDYESYQRTRAFYRGVGFSDHERIPRDDPECPESLVLAMDVLPAN